MTWRDDEDGAMAEERRLRAASSSVCECCGQAVKGAARSVASDETEQGDALNVGACRNLRAIYP